MKMPAIVDEHRQWYKDSALNKILHYIKVYDNVEAGIVLEVKSLEKCTWKFFLIMMSNTPIMFILFWKRSDLKK